MKQVYSEEGRRRLASAWIVLAASIATSAALIVGTNAYLEKEERHAADGNRRLQEARARVENRRRDRASVEESAALFSTLLARGLMQPERRLDLVERMNGLRTQHRLSSVEYEIAPQRPLPLSGNRPFSAVDIVASRVTVKARGLHEGDVLDFIDALSESAQGFHPVDRCHFKRIDGAPLQPRIEADCALEWITLRERPVA